MRPIARLDKKDLLLFLIPILTVPTVNVVGVLMYSDLAVALLTPYLLMRRRPKPGQRYTRQIMILIVVWFFGVVISDQVNGSSLTNSLRGMASVFFFGLHLFVFFKLVDGKRKRLVPAIVGSAVAYLVLWGSGASAFSSKDLTDIPWKMGGGFAVTILFVCFFRMLLRDEKRVGALLIIFAPLHLILNARSLFLTTVMAGIASAFGMRVRKKKTRSAVILFFSIVIVMSAPLATTVYGTLNEAGVFGEQARAKYLEQTAGGKINIILAGRGESLVSLQAISDKPILGHGSWAESSYYVTLYLSLMEELGREVNWGEVDQKDRLLIPTHSMLGGAWVYHGIFGASFWLFILYLTVRAISQTVSLSGSRYKVTTLELLVLFALFWDIFFSPFGQARRCLEAIYIVVACLVVSDASD